MSRKLIVVYDPGAHPSIEISVDKNGDPKTDLLIFCDVIVTLIKLLKDNGLQDDYESVKIVSDRINDGFLCMDNVVAESCTGSIGSDFNVAPTDEDAIKRDTEHGDIPEESLPPKQQEQPGSHGDFLDSIEKLKKHKHKQKDPVKELINDINAAICKQDGKVQFGQLLGAIENIKLDIYCQHYKRSGLLWAGGL